MALIECNECGAQVSDKASKCPKCGNPMKAGKAEQAKTFFKDDKPIKFAKENIIREWSPLEILFLMKHNFE